MSNPTNEGEGTKLVFVGDSGVGKTCIIGRFLKGTFDDNVLSTTGSSYARKTIEIPEIKKKLVVDVWDTAGQEKYKALAKIFFKGAKMAILVYDITRKESFENIKNNWYKDIKEYCAPDVVIGIAGNKSDLYEYEEVSGKEAGNFAKSIDAVFYLTSAQSNTGINELLEDLGKKFLDLNPSIDESNENIQSIKQEESNIKIGKNEVDKINEEKKKKKGFC